MDITLYKYSGDRRVVQKNLTNGLAINNARLIENTEVQAPILRFSKTINSNNVMLYNYAYIPLFGRYYYIRKIEADAGEQVTAFLQVDVLKSFWNDFKASPCIASRSSNLYDDEIDDSEVITLSTKSYEHRTLNGKFTPVDSTYNYVVTVAGGGTSQG